MSTTDDTTAEVQRLMSNPYGTALALVEARAEIERLRVDLAEERNAHALTKTQWDGDYRATRSERDAAREERDQAVEYSNGQGMTIAEQRIQLAAAESQIAALKVEVAAMMKERDAMSAWGEDQYTAVGLQEMRADHAEAKLARAVVVLRERSIRRDIAAKHSGHYSECALCNGRWDEDGPDIHDAGCILADPTTTAAADAYEREREERAELEAVAEAAKYLQTRRIEHGRDANAEDALFDALTRLEIAKARRGECKVCGGLRVLYQRPCPECTDDARRAGGGAK